MKKKLISFFTLILFCGIFGGAYYFKMISEYRHWEGEWEVKTPPYTSFKFKISNCQKKTCDFFAYSGSADPKLVFKKSENIVTTFVHGGKYSPEKECRVDLQKLDTEIGMVNIQFIGKDCDYLGLVGKNLKGARISKEIFISNQERFFSCFATKRSSELMKCTDKDLSKMENEIIYHQKSFFLGNFKNGEIKESFIKNKLEENYKECDQKKSKSEQKECVRDGLNKILEPLNNEFYAYLNNPVSKDFKLNDFLQFLYPRLNSLSSVTGNECSEGNETLKSFKVKEMSFLPDHYLILSQTECYFSHNGLFTIAKNEKGRLSIIDSTTFFSQYMYDLEFDLAKYLISDDLRAFGFRYKDSSGGSGGGSLTEKLNLYILSDDEINYGRKKLEKVFTGDMTLAEYGICGKDCYGNFTSILVVDQSKKTPGNGTYDWIIKTKYYPRGEKLDTKKLLRTADVRYVWDFARDKSDFDKMRIVPIEHPIYD